MTSNNNYSAFTDRNQNFWQLASIQSVIFGLPTLVLGGQFSRDYGPGTAVLSVLVGNLLLWLIGLSTIAMAYTERKNAIQNLVGYVGKFGSLLGGIVLLLAFLFWYTIQLKTTTTLLGEVLPARPLNISAADVRLGVVLGLSISLLAIGGIKLIKWVSVIVFPLLFAFVGLSTITNGQSVSFSGTWGFSIPAIAATIAVNLTGVVNYPTFFRHAKSRSHAFSALSLIAVFISLIECSSIYLDFSSSSTLIGLYNIGSAQLNLILIGGFLVLSLLTVNLVNIYFASAAWESIFPKVRGGKKYAIVGLAGTVAYTFIQADKPMQYAENVLGGFIVSLGIVLLMAFLVRMVVNHRQRLFEQLFNILCWVLGCLTVIYVQNRTNLSSPAAFFSGIAVSSLIFILIAFLEETFWSFLNLRKVKNDILD